MFYSMRVNVCKVTKYSGLNPSGWMLAPSESLLPLKINLKSKRVLIFKGWPNFASNTSSPYQFSCLKQSLQNPTRP